ncbi:MAG: hypothetical protein VCD00_01250 [Candidatus Hydrogenedentota bacterium]
MQTVTRKVILALTFAIVGIGHVSAEPTITQITHGPAHHFYGYIGHVGNTPWSGDGSKMVMLRTTFQDHMPRRYDTADIVLLDTQNNYALTKIEETRAWNPQQGTMLYWNPEAPNTQFFFNDRDRRTRKIFCVLYDIEKQKRIKEYRFDDISIGNGGIAQKGGYFLGLNYGRMDRLRRVTGYPEAFDWTNGVLHPKDDGIHKVNVATGERTLLVSFAQLADMIAPRHPHIDKSSLFINHSLWSPNDQRIMFYARANWNVKVAPRINDFFTVDADGTNLVIHKVCPGGHPEWLSDSTVISGGKVGQFTYDAARQAGGQILGNDKIFPDPEGDIALSPNGTLLVNGHKSGEGNEFTIYNLKTKKWMRTPPITRGEYKKGDLRIDPAPTWHPDNQAIAVPGLAPDGTRQTFIIEFNTSELD